MSLRLKKVVSASAVKVNLTRIIFTGIYLFKVFVFLK